jgi:hypothetical protein
MEVPNSTENSLQIAKNARDVSMLHAYIEHVEAGEKKDRDRSWRGKKIMQCVFITKLL